MMTIRIGSLIAPALGLACLFQAGEVQAKVVRIRIADMAFVPPAVAATVGDVVEWNNDDFVDHTATDTAGGFNVTIAAGKKVSVGIAEPGHFVYFCRFHPNMKGSLTIK